MYIYGVTFFEKYMVNYDDFTNPYQKKSKIDQMRTDTSIGHRGSIQLKNSLKYSNRHNILHVIIYVEYPRLEAVS